MQRHKKLKMDGWMDGWGSLCRLGGGATPCHAGCVTRKRGSVHLVSARCEAKTSQTSQNEVRLTQVRRRAGIVSLLFLLVHLYKYNSCKASVWLWWPIVTNTSLLRQVSIITMLSWERCSERFTNVRSYQILQGTFRTVAEH